MATTDIRFKRINDEYQSVRNAQDDLFDKVNTFDEKVAELFEVLKRNNDMLDAIIKHLDIPYRPRPIGIAKPRLKSRQRPSTMAISAGVRS